MRGRGPLPHLLIASAVGVILLSVLMVTGFQVSVWPWMLFFVLGGAAWWVVNTDEAPARPVGWEPPRPDTEPMRFSADLQTRRTASMIADAHPSRGFTAVGLTGALAARARSRLVRRHGLHDDDPIAHSEGLLSPQLRDYLSRAGTDRAQTITPRTLRLYLKEIEAL